MLTFKVGDKVRLIKGKKPSESKDPSLAEYRENDGSSNAYKEGVEYEILHICTNSRSKEVRNIKCKPNRYWIPSDMFELVNTKLKQPFQVGDKVELVSGTDLTDKSLLPSDTIMSTGLKFNPEYVVREVNYREKYNDYTIRLNSESFVHPASIFQLVKSKQMSDNPKIFIHVNTLEECKALTNFFRTVKGWKPSVGDRIFEEGYRYVSYENYYSANYSERAGTETIEFTVFAALFDIKVEQKVELKLNDSYKAIVNKSTKTVEVGGSVFTFEVIEKLLKLTKEND